MKHFLDEIALTWLIVLAHAVVSIATFQVVVTFAVKETKMLECTC